jgi:hypothetical protein
MTNKSNDTLNTLKHDAQDTADEVKQRAAAAAEHVKRNVEGDSMPLGEKIASNVKEALHKTQADIDAAKRDVRHDSAAADDKV